MTTSPLNYDGEINLQYGRKTLVFNGKIADESSGRNAKYIAEAKATHSPSNFNFDFKSEIKNDRETVGGNMQFQFLAASDRQMKNMKLRTEINKLRNELNFEVSNSITFRVDYSFCTHLAIRAMSTLP